MQLNFFLFLQSEYEKLKGKQEEHLNARLESKTKGIEKIMMENERLRKDIKKVYLFFDNFHYLHVSKTLMYVPLIYHI